VGFENNALDVRRILDESHASDDVLIRMLFEYVSAGILVVPLDSRIYLVDGNPMLQEPVRQDHHLVLFEIAAEGVYFIDPRNAFQQRIDDPFLNRS